MPTYVRTDKCDGCKGQDKTACMYICPHDLMMLDKDGSVTGHSLITDTRATVIQSPQCVAYLSWNNIGPNGNNFIDTSAASLRQYRDFANDPYYALTR